MLVLKVLTKLESEFHSSTSVEKKLVIKYRSYKPKNNDMSYFSNVIRVKYYKPVSLSKRWRVTDSIFVFYSDAEFVISERLQVGNITSTTPDSCNSKYLIIFRLIYEYDLSKILLSGITISHHVLHQNSHEIFLKPCPWVSFIFELFPVEFFHTLLA